MPDVSASISFISFMASMMQKDLAGLDTVADSDEGRRPGGRALVEGADDGRFHEDLGGVGRLLFGALVRVGSGGIQCHWRGSRKRRGVRLGCQCELLLGGEGRTPDANAAISALHFKLRNSRFGCQIDQLTNFINCHQWISLTSVGLGPLCWEDSATRGASQGTNVKAMAYHTRQSIAGKRGATQRA